MPAGRVLCFPHFALRGCQGIEPDTSELLLSWCPLSFALSQSHSLQRRRCPETEPRRVWLGQDPIKPPGEGHPRPWLLPAMIPEPVLKRPLTWFEQAVPLESCLWFGFCCLEREERGQATHRQEKAEAKAVRWWGGALTVMLQVQMALCFMCGLNGLCQPSYWRRITWRDHTKTLSTEIQRFINKGHFHDSKCLLDGQGSTSHHQEDESLANPNPTISAEVGIFWNITSQIWSWCHRGVRR